MSKTDQKPHSAEGLLARVPWVSIFRGFSRQPGARRPPPLTSSYLIMPISYQNAGAFCWKAAFEILKEAALRSIFRLESGLVFCREQVPQ